MTMIRTRTFTGTGEGAGVLLRGIPCPGWTSNPETSFPPKIPAKAGIQGLTFPLAPWIEASPWTPAFAGVIGGGVQGEGGGEA